MDQMQQELQATYPLLRIRLLGINEPNQEAGNAGTTHGRAIPWIQDVDVNSNGRADAAMDLWQMAFRDVVILDGQNQKVGVYNLSQHDLAKTSNYNTLKEMFIDAAMTSQKPWRNSANPLDVDNSGAVVPLDVLRIINVLNESGPHKLPPPTADQSPPPFLDTNGDGNIAPTDALLVINWLNSQSVSQGEGEAMAIDASPDAWTATAWIGGLGASNLATARPESPLPADRVLIDSPLADGYSPVRSPDDAARIAAVDRILREDDATNRKDESCEQTEPDGFGLRVFNVPYA